MLNYLWTRDVNSLSYIWFTDILVHSVDCLMIIYIWTEKSWPPHVLCLKPPFLWTDVWFTNSLCSRCSSTSRSRLSTTPCRSPRSTWSHTTSSKTSTDEFMQGWCPSWTKPWGMSPKPWRATGSWTTQSSSCLLYKSQSPRDRQK